MMLFINQYSHIPFLTRELKQLLPNGSFASRMKQAIGNELHYRLVDWPDESETEYSSLFPVDALFDWATKDGGLDPEWLASDDGSYLADDGEVMPPSMKPSYSAVEQLAAYGLWLLDEQMESLGPIPENDADIGPLPEHNCYGWKRDEVIEHRAACMLLAYQSLSYCQRILSGTRLTAEEEARAEKFNFSALGKAGAQKRHAPMAALRSWALEKYRAGEWRSANQAAHSLKDSIIKHGRTINAHLTEENAQRTIAEWFRKSV
jgi:hypothetical protein